MNEPAPAPVETPPERTELELLEAEFFEQRRSMHASLIVAATTACLLTIGLDALLGRGPGVTHLVLKIAAVAFAGSALLSLRQSEARRAEIARFLQNRSLALELSTYVRPRASSDALSLLARAAFAFGLLLVVGASVLLF